MLEAAPFTERSYYSRLLEWLTSCLWVASPVEGGDPEEDEPDPFPATGDEESG